MKLSIFTPSHDTKFLKILYDSIKDQPFDEWVLMLNNKAQNAKIEFDDDRVKIIRIDDKIEYVGGLKRRAVQFCTGDILLELDHDDELLPNAIKEVKKAFEDPEVGFVYSNAVYSTDKYKECSTFSDAYGWKYRDYFYKGNKLKEHITFEPRPETVSRIWAAPNHLRAFRREVYDKVGGYNKNMRILDDQDLMSRMYRITKFKHIDKPLYLYKVHGQNTWLKYNKEIQGNVYPLFDKYIDGMIDKWVWDQRLRLLDLGGRFNSRSGYETVDKKEADIIADLNDRWPFKDNEVGVLRAYDVIEHLKDPIHFMKEAYRVLVPGGFLNIRVPSTNGRGAFQDPTHVSYFNLNSFLYYTHRDWAKYIDKPVRFQQLRLYETVLDRNQVCWITSRLLNLKGGFRPYGLINI